jgi:hypothetical protein
LALSCQAPKIGGTSPPQHDLIPTIFPAQPSTDLKSVTFPKSSVTFAEMRICVLGVVRGHKKVRHQRFAPISDDP